ncbi:hypothetical protein [Tumebacillus flagellatus]|uniref:Uncharacterized protein n=1 Tax=Tumebacillus flagellatus TaxID=1157490 RepID=A0A074LRG1_9BACL|nr:hypothetical protein [Tumebacillus flagellatus]KEO84716.1 hypothetical protein EL26_04145 [Tumebacillus flagellatus]
MKGLGKLLLATTLGFIAIFCYFYISITSNQQAVLHPEVAGRDYWLNLLQTSAVPYVFAICVVGVLACAISEILQRVQAKKVTKSE